MKSLWRNYPRENVAKKKRATRVFRFENFRVTGFGGLWGWVIYVFLCCLDGSGAPLDQISPSQYPPDTPHIAGFPQDSVRFMLKISFSSEIRPGSHPSGVGARGWGFNLVLTYLRTLWAREGFV